MSIVLAIVVIVGLLAITPAPRHVDLPDPQADSIV